MSLEALKAYVQEHQESAPQNEPKMNVNAILASNMELMEFREELLESVAANIRESELLRSKINGAVKGGADIYNILDDALKCISLMTGDTVFYRQNSEALKKRKNIETSAI